MNSVISDPCFCACLLPRLGFIVEIKFYCLWSGHTFPTLTSKLPHPGCFGETWILPQPPHPLHHTHHTSLTTLLLTLLYLLTSYTSPHYNSPYFTLPHHETLPHHKTLNHIISHYTSMHYTLPHNTFPHYSSVLKQWCTALMYCTTPTLYFTTLQQTSLY